MKISFEGNGGIWKTYPTGAKLEWDMVSKSTTTRKRYFHIPQVKSGLSALPNDQKCDMDLWDPFLVSLYEILIFLSGECDMDLWDLFPESVIWDIEIHFWRVWHGFVRSIFKCEIWHIERMEFEAETWVIMDITT